MDSESRIFTMQNYFLTVMKANIYTKYGHTLY